MLICATSYEELCWVASRKVLLNKRDLCIISSQHQPVLALRDIVKSIIFLLWNALMEIARLHDFLVSTHLTAFTHFLNPIPFHLAATNLFLVSMSSLFCLFACLFLGSTCKWDHISWVVLLNDNVCSGAFSLAENLSASYCCRKFLFLNHHSWSFSFYSCRLASQSGVILFLLHLHLFSFKGIISN